jgi:UDPglucose 6-dehydrogenase
MKPKLSVVGLGKLGACSAACFSARGFSVVGVDINKDYIDAINSHKAPVIEPGLQDMITASKDNLWATQDFEEAISNSDITFLIVPTPSKQDGHFSNRYLKNALKNLARALKETDKKYHLFVIVSTVSPGATEGVIIPLIESVSGKKLNEDFGVCYSPEFIALGSVIKDFLNPNVVLIGESDRVAGDLLAEVYGNVCENDPVIARMSIVSAEITKISLNSYITMKISFANTLANICESIPGADVDDITRALGADKRISPYYIKGGLGFGGPCFPRDNRAFVAFAGKYGCDGLLAETTDKVNNFQLDHLARKVLQHIPEKNNKMVSVLGLAYKPDTPVIEESPSIRLIERLLKEDLEIIVYDPLAMDNARAHFEDNVLYASSVKDCLSNSSVCIITTQEDEFKSIDGSYLKGPTTVIDCWRILDPSKFDDKIKYVGLGKP